MLTQIPGVNEGDPLTPVLEFRPSHRQPGKSRFQGLPANSNLERQHTVPGQTGERILQDTRR